MVPAPSTPLRNSGTLSSSGQYGSLSRQEQRKMVLAEHSKDIGVLVLHSIYLNGLSDEADPYLVIESGDWQYVTERRDSNPDPRWNCWFSFPFNGLGPTLKFTLMDHGFWQDDEQAFFQFDTESLKKEATPQSDAIREGRFTVRDRTVSFFIDFKFQAWPAAFPLEDKNSKGNNAERQHELQKPEAFMRAVHFAISLQIQKWTPITCDSIPVPVTPKGTRLSTIESLDGYFFVLEEDLDVPIPPEAGILIKLINMLPFDDETIHFISRQEAIEYVHRVFGGLIIDPTEGTWQDLTSDEAMSRYCFYNNGAVFMEKNPQGGYVCNVEYLRDFPVRPGYFSYGGAAYFDEKGKITHITYGGKTYKPDGTPKWEFMKLVVRSTIFVCAAGIHLMQGHLTWSNYPNYAMRKALGPDHPIRRLLHVHFWRSAMVCSKSLQSLIPEKGLLHRGTGFEIEGLHDFYRYALDKFKFETFPDDLKARGMETAPPEIYPTTNDGMLFYNMISNYVSSFIDIHYKTDLSVTSDQELVEFWDVCQERLSQPGRKFNLEEKKTFPKLSLENLKIVITEFIFRVTAWHQNIGNALAPINDPCTIALRLFEDQPISSVQSLYVQGLVTMLTSMRMPTMSSNGSWIHMFRGDKEVKVYNDFRDAMNGLSQEIIKLNKEREGKGYRIVDYDPRYTCVSVSS